VEAAALTELQVAILRVFWTLGEATTQEVHDALGPARRLAPTTVATLLSRLERRGVLAYRRRGRQHVYRALVSERQVRRTKVKGLMESLFGGDPAALVSHLVRSDEMDADELARIRALLEAHTHESGDPEGHGDGEEAGGDSPEGPEGS